MRQDPVEKTRSKTQELELEKSVKVIQGNFSNICVSEPDVVTLFLLRKVNDELRPKLEIELRTDARIVNHDYEIPGWEPLKKEKMELKRITRFSYTVAGMFREEAHYRR